jgi:hypothetical protein
LTNFFGAFLRFCDFAGIELSLRRNQYYSFKQASGVATTHIVTTGFNPLKKKLHIKRTIDSAHMLSWITVIYYEINENTGIYLKDMRRAYGTPFHLVYDQRILIRCYNMFEPMAL